MAAALESVEVRKECPRVVVPKPKMVVPCTLSFGCILKSGHRKHCQVPVCTKQRPSACRVEWEDIEAANVLRNL